MSMVDKQYKETGFALLVSLIVVGVVLSVGLVILDLTIKQVRLATTNKDSEVAFHAANAGMECARYWRRSLTADMTTGAPASGVSCFGQPATNVSPTNVPLASGSGGNAWRYSYQFTWGPANDRCTRVDTVSAVAPAFAADAVIQNSTMQGIIPGYPGTADVTCPAGSQCTTIAVRGYNQACPAGNFGYGVVERQVLLEF